MTYHPKSNSRWRRRKRLISRKLLGQYRHGLHPQVQTDSNRREQYEFRITDQDGEIIYLRPVPMKSPTGEKGNLVAHSGPPENIPYLLLFS